MTLKDSASLSSCNITNTRTFSPFDLPPPGKIYLSFANENLAVGSHVLHHDFIITVFPKHMILEINSPHGRNSSRQPVPGSIIWFEWHLAIWLSQMQIDQQPLVFTGYIPKGWHSLPFLSNAIRRGWSCPLLHRLLPNKFQAYHS